MHRAVLGAVHVRRVVGSEAISATRSGLVHSPARKPSAKPTSPPVSSRRSARAIAKLQRRLRPRRAPSRAKSRPTAGARRGGPRQDRRAVRRRDAKPAPQLLQRASCRRSGHSHRSILFSGMIGSRRRRRGLPAVRIPCAKAWRPPNGCRRPPSGQQRRVAQNRRNRSRP